MSDFVNFKLAKKLKEKGFDCKYPFAMYDEDGDFYPLFTSCDEDEDSKCIFGKRMYYGYDDFVGDKDAVIAPTISQVLKWLRDEKKLHIEFVGNACGYLYIVSDIPCEGGTDRYCSDYSGPNDGGTWNNYEDCALNAIQYVLDNLIKNK